MMDFMFFGPLFSIFVFLFAIAIPVVVVIVVVALILSHRDNVQKSDNPTGDTRKLYKSETDKMLAASAAASRNIFTSIPL